MIDILKDLSTLEAFIDEETFSSLVTTAIASEEVPPICNDYNLPDYPISSPGMNI